jgi:hypothetical protein
MLGKHLKEPETPEVIEYDPYAKIVINTCDSFSSVVPEVMTAGQLAIVFRNEKMQTKSLAGLRGRIAKVEEYIKENLDELDEHAKEIAKLLDIVLTETKDVTVTVEVSLTIDLDCNDDLDDFIQNLSFSVESGYGNFDSDVTDSYGSVQDWSETS